MIRRVKQPYPAGNFKQNFLKTESLNEYNRVQYHTAYESKIQLMIWLCLMVVKV